MDADELTKIVQGMLKPRGFECYRFKVGWYNEKVADKYKINYDPETFALIIISTPSMFEKTFKRFVKRTNCKVDPIDNCVKEQMKHVQGTLSGVAIDFLPDGVDDSGQPFILVQTAGHLAGGVRYYQRMDIINDPWPKDKKIYGVSIHHIYGGWFAFHGALVFKDIKVPNLPYQDPPDPVPDDEDRIELLRRYNDHWEDWSYRDIIPVGLNEKYSEQQQRYFRTPKEDRMRVIDEILAQDGDDPTGQ